MVCGSGKKQSVDRSRRLTRSSDDVKRAALDELTARFDASLASLRDPETPQKVRRIFAAKGRLRNPPKAGETF